MIQFGLFLLVNAVLVLRPAELVPGWEKEPIYEVVILAALAASARSVVGQLAPAALKARPVTLFILGILAAVMVSHVAWGRTWESQESGFDFLKIVLYFLLLMANLRTFARLRLFAEWIVGLLFIHVGLALLQYAGHIDVEALRPFKEKELEESTELLRELSRLRGAGIFNDPNEFCVLLSVGFLFALYFLGDRQAGVLRWLWSVPLVVFAAAVPLTHSRGGMLALLAGLSVLAIIRYGARRAIVLMAIVLPLIVLALAGRQTKLSLDNPADTAQHRLHLWSDGLMMFRDSPLFGVGQGRYPELAGLGAHNSFLEAYAELGILGGACFVAAVAYPILGLLRARRRLHPVRHRDQLRMCQFLLAVVVTQAVGMMSLSRVYTQPTYFVVGLGAAFIHLLTFLPSVPPRLTVVVAVRLFLLGLGLLLFLHVFTTLLIHRV